MAEEGGYHEKGLQSSNVLPKVCCGVHDGILGEEKRIGCASEL
jgi:hypothetical protein